MTENMTTMTDDQLRELVEAGQTAQAEAEAKARTARDRVETARAGLNSEAAAAAAELEAREQAEARRIRARERDWSDWFLNRGGYRHATAAAVDEQRSAEKALREALDADPVYQAMVRYRAAGDYRARVFDLRTRAVHALGLDRDTMSAPAMGFENRINVDRTVAEHIDRQANNHAADWYDALNDAVDQTVHAHDDALSERLPDDPEAVAEAQAEHAHTVAEFQARPRVEQQHHDLPAGPKHQVRRVRVLRDLDTGQTLTIDNPNDPNAGVVGVFIDDEFTPMDELTAEQSRALESGTWTEPGHFRLSR